MTPPSYSQPRWMARREAIATSSRTIPTYLSRNFTANLESSAGLLVHYICVGTMLDYLNMWRVNSH
jgi:phage gp36-like protein